MFLADDFLALDDAPEEAAKPPLKQTRSLGRKQSAARWLPELIGEQGVLAAGSWDDAENVVALWSVSLSRSAADDDEAMLDAAGDSRTARLRHRDV